MISRSGPLLKIGSRWITGTDQCSMNWILSEKEREKDQVKEREKDQGKKREKEQEKEQEKKCRTSV